MDLRGLLAAGLGVLRQVQGGARVNVKLEGHAAAKCWGGGGAGGRINSRT